jgi:integrase
MSVREYMDNWLYNTLKLKGMSLDSKESTLKNQVYPFIGDLQIGNVTANDIDVMINTLIKKGYSHSTIKKAYDSVSACFNTGIDRGEILRNPCRGVKLPKNQKKPAESIRFFTDDEIQRIITESTSKYSNGKPKHRLGHGVVLLLFTGIRIGEAIALTWDDVDFDKKELRIDKNAEEIIDRTPGATKKRVVTPQETPKSPSSIRDVALEEIALDALRGLREINGKHEFVFASANGTYLQYRNFNRMFESILKRCGIEPCGSHTCRHSFASMLIRNGVHIKVVSEMLGHADVAFTMNRYVHIMKEQKQEAAKSISDVFKQFEFDK